MSGPAYYRLVVFMFMLFHTQNSFMLFTFENCFGFRDDGAGAKCITFSPQQTGQLGFPLLHWVVLIEACLDDALEQIFSSFYK